MADNQPHSEVISTIKIDMANIKKDVAHISSTVNKMDVMMQSIIDIHRNLAVQEANFTALRERVEAQNKVFSAHVDSADRHRDKIERELDELKANVDHERKSANKEVMDKLDKVVTEIQKDREADKKILDKHEQWFYWGAGVVAVLVFLLNAAPVWDLLGAVTRIGK